MAIEKFSEVSDELLSKVNKKLEFLNFRPKKLRIKYSTIFLIQVMIQYYSNDIGHGNLTYLFDYFRSKIVDK